MAHGPWAVVDVIPPGGCDDCGKVLHNIGGRWRIAGAALQTCIEELVQLGMPESTASQFKGYSRCFS